ncbi:MAG: hypothetical protein L0K65_05570, partial [Actinomyces sp.]|nr:hypothetical protein [Actinomyces sp.]
GNWGLAPCSYRFADTTDLITNSTGTLLGVVLEALTPRLLSTKSHLLTQRDRARPVTATRRLLGMALDGWYLAMAALTGGTLGSVVFSLSHGVAGQTLTEAQMLALEHTILTGAWVAALVVALLPALVGTGASLGQRTVYLRPRGPRRSRPRCLLRATAVQAAVPTLMYTGFPQAVLGPLLAVIAIAWAVPDPRGLSYRVAGLGIGDARERDAPAPHRRGGAQ